VLICAAVMAVGGLTSGAGAKDVGAGDTSPGFPKGTSEQQTHPRMVPRVGRRHTAFAVEFTLADAPGHQGVVATDYRIDVAVPSAKRAGCTPAPPPIVDAGEQGTTVSVGLPEPVHGWCARRYHVTVFLQRGPYCLAPAPGEPPPPCPEFASQDLDVGHAHFTVHRAARR
jgi:hypothetical protein